MADKPVYEIDGKDFKNLDEFFVVISKLFNLYPDSRAVNFIHKSKIDLPVWGHNLAAFNDILRGGFGELLPYPSPSFVLKWKNHQISEQKLKEFGELVQIIEAHGPGESERGNIDLILE